MVLLFHIVQNGQSLFIQVGGGDVPHNLTIPQQYRPADEVVDLGEQVGGEDDRLGGLQNPQQHFVEVLSIEHIVSGKGFIHENVVRTLAQSQNHLHLVLLAHRHGTQGTVSRQAEEVHEGFKPLIPPGGEVLPVEDPVLLGGESGEKGVLTGGKAETGDVVPADGYPVQGDGALIGQ